MSDFKPQLISPKSEHPGFIPPVGASAQGRPFISTSQLATVSAGKKRRMTKAKTSPVLKRAVSTPHMGGLGPHEAGGLSPSALDKRRNKLGYQRISIACGHCRRRKIRCVLAETDELGRCQNCIRLKKECVFYPVDSVGGTESRAQQKSGLGSKASSVMSSSPSERKPGGTGESDHDHEFGRFPPLASNAPSDLPLLSPGGGLGLSAASSMTTPEFGYESATSARDGWHSGIYQQPDSAHSDASTTGSWRVQDSPRVGDYSNFASSDGQSTGMYSAYQYPPSRPEYGMQTPLRSMSYGNIEPVIGGFQPTASTNPVDYPRQSAPHYTLATADTAHTPSTSAMLDPAIAPVGTESMPHFGLYSSTQWSYLQQNPQAMGAEFPRHDSVNMQWYHPGQMVPSDEQNMQNHQQHSQQQQQQQQHQHQQQQQVHQQQWQQQQQHHHLMLPPATVYNRGHSPG